MKQDFQKLLDSDKYQVFLFRCRAHFPFNFADHLWFVVNERGGVSRWEVLYIKNKAGTHVWKDANAPFRGISVMPFLRKLHWRSELLHMIEGDEDSTARRMADFIENSGRTYPYRDRYSLLGPQCATYVQWVLNQFPEFGFKLKNYIGKNYNK